MKKDNFIRIMCILFLSSLFFLDTDGKAQNISSFQISFVVDITSADETLRYFEWQHSNIERLTALKGNQLAIATSLLLAREKQSLNDFKNHIENYRSGVYPQNDRYGLLPLRQRTTELRQLLTHIRGLQLQRRIGATIAQYFPASLKLDISIPVYIVVFGNERAVAVVRNVQWKDGAPSFPPDDDGEPTILVNLARLLDEENNVQFQTHTLLQVLAHEAFHAVYNILKRQYPDSLKARTPAEVLLELVHNEGIAYYISLELQRQGRQMPLQWFRETDKAIGTLSDVLAELQSPATPPPRIRELLLNANLSGHFSANYGVAAGLRMAYEIDSRLGREKLASTLEYGFKEFIRLYQQCVKENAVLVPLKNY